MRTETTPAAVTSIRRARAALATAALATAALVALVVGGCAQQTAPSDGVSGPATTTPSASPSATPVAVDVSADVADDLAALEAEFDARVGVSVVDTETGDAVYGTGGGITWDSEPAAEHAEVVTKAAVLSAHVHEFELLETLHAAGGCDLLLSDVDMPRLNGFELTARLRADARFAHLPVVLVTSLEAPHDREQGIAAGADAYIVKRAFDQHALLDTINHLI